MAQSARTRDVDSSSGLPIAAGATMGGVAYVVNYLVTFAFVMLESDGNSFDTNDYLFELVGWVLYNAHFVPTELSASGLGVSQSETTNFLAQAPNLTVPRPLWTLVIVVALAVAGYVVASRSSGSGQKAGAAVVIGYLPLAVAGTFLFQVNRGNSVGNATIGPETIPAIVVAGIAFPVICGAIGGLFNSGPDL